MLSLPPPSCRHWGKAMGGHSKKVGICNSGRGLSPKSSPSGTLILDFQFLTLWEINSSCVNHPVCVILFWQPELRYWYGAWHTLGSWCMIYWLSTLISTLEPPGIRPPFSWVLSLRLTSTYPLPWFLSNQVTNRLLHAPSSGIPAEPRSLPGRSDQTSTVPIVNQALGTGTEHLWLSAFTWLRKPFHLPVPSTLSGKGWPLIHQCSRQLFWNLGSFC